MNPQDSQSILEEFLNPLTNMTKGEEVELMPSTDETKYFNTRDLIMRHIDGLLRQPKLSSGQVELLKALLSTIKV